jgi:hypothetical protein
VDPARERAVIELGRRLCFDPAVSRSGTRACATCHDPELAFADDSPTGRDEHGDTARTSQTLLETASAGAFHWDGEFATVEDLVFARAGPVPVTPAPSSYAPSRGPVPPVSDSIEARGRYR